MLIVLLSLQISIAISPATQLASQQTPQPTLNNCEMNVHNLDTAHHLAGDDSIIVAIAHLGTGERNRELNRRRLHNVRAYLTDFAWKRRPATVVTAEGESVNGYGRIDIYVRGGHWTSLAVRRNGDLIVGLCEPDYMRGREETMTFYPFRDRKKPLTHRRSISSRQQKMTDKVEKSEEQWRKELTPEQYHVLREAGTERAFTGAYWDNHGKGIYRCAACGLELFSSDTKFDSGTGWPSYFAPISEANVIKETDSSLGMVRTEVKCRRCGSHLGHVFDDGPKPPGLRYCINSVSLNFEEKR